MKPQIKLAVLRIIFAIPLAIATSGCVDVLSEEESDIQEQLEIVGTQPEKSSIANVGTKIRVTFSGEVVPESVDKSTMIVRDGRGPVPGQVRVNGRSLEFETTENLPPSESISVTVSGDVTDTEGNVLGTEHTWEFQTLQGSAVPELESFEQAMVDGGTKWGEYMDPQGPNTQDQQFFHEFYSSANSFQKISEYLGTPEPWSTYAKWSNQVYRNYLQTTEYRTQGYRRFTHGMYGDWSKGGISTPAEIEMLRDNPAYSNVREGRGQGGAEHRSREVGLAVISNVHAEMSGSTRVLEDGKPRLETFVPWMGSHLYEWRTGDYRGTPNKGEPRFAPFMFGITANALISFIEWERQNGRDENAYWNTTYPIDYGSGLTEGATPVNWPTIIDALEDVATWAVEESHADDNESVRMWVPDGNGYASFRYESLNSDGGPATDLNLLIAPAYAWLWKETGNTKYRDWADQLFGAGALNSVRVTLRSGKHFNQQFLFSFDYIRWRQEGDAKWLQ